MTCDTAKGKMNHLKNFSYRFSCANWSETILKPIYSSELPTLEGILGHIPATSIDPTVFWSMGKVYDKASLHPFSYPTHSLWVTQILIKLNKTSGFHPGKRVFLTWNIWQFWKIFWMSCLESWAFKRVSPRMLAKHTTMHREFLNKVIAFQNVNNAEAMGQQHILVFVRPLGGQLGVLHSGCGLVGISWGLAKCLGLLAAIAYRLVWWSHAF